MKLAFVPGVKLIVISPFVLPGVTIPVEVSNVPSSITLCNVMVDVPPSARVHVLAALLVPVLASVTVNDYSDIL